MRVLYLFLLLFTLFSCQEQKQREVIKVLASDSYRHALPEINNRFVALFNAEVEVEYASSTELSHRIQNGADADVFLTDDIETQTFLLGQSLLEKGSQQLLDGVLVVWTMKNLAFDDSLSVLRTNSIIRIGVANTDSCEFGRVSQSALLEMNMPNNVFSKLRSYPNLEATTDALLKGEVDLVFMDKSTVVSAQYAGIGFWYEVPIYYYFPIEHSVSKITNRNKKLQNEVQAYFQFMGEMEASRIFEKYGFSRREEPMSLGLPF